MTSSSKVEFSSAKQPMLFKDNEEIDEILNTNEHKRTMFLAWFEVNKIYLEGQHLTYYEYPSQFVWMADRREWKPRMMGVSIGRLTYISPVGQENYIISRYC